MDNVNRLLTMRREHELDAADLARGLAAEEIGPHYQPTASRGRRWIVDGVEALARWHHPRLGVVTPDELIPLAERSGAIGAVTAAVLEQAVRQLRDWSGAGIELRCAVNLPPSVVTDLGFPERLADILARHRVDGRSLSLEITETATLREPTRTLAMLTRLRAIGVGIALDDFGTGYSSITQLYQMPFDELKIDKSLVASIAESREAHTLVGSLIELGHNLGLAICAEGVESREALDLLAALGCDRCQGFYISRALPADDVPRFVEQWNQAAAGKRSPARRRAGARSAR